MTEHPLTAQMILDIQDEIHDSIILGLDVETNPIRVGADWQLEQVLRWFQFDYGTDPNLSRERKMRGGFKEISAALEKAMRPQEKN